MIRKSILLLIMALMAAPAWAGIIARGYGSGSQVSGTSLTVKLPAGFQANDVAIIHISTRNVVVPTPPAGFTAIANTASNLSNVYRSDCFVGVLTAGQGNPVFTVGNVAVTYEIGVYIGVNTSTPVDVASVQQTTTNNTVATSPSVAAAAATDELVMVYSGDFAATYSAPSLGTLQTQVDAGAASDTISALVDVALSASGATGAQTITQSRAATSIGTQIALSAATTSAHQGFLWMMPFGTLVASGGGGGGGGSTAHLNNLPPGAALPSEATCAANANASGFPETNSLNVNDGTGWDANNQIWTTPSYFKTNAGGSIIGFSNSDFANVDGNYSGSTQGILRWTACKWGADEDWVYAEAKEEKGNWDNNCAQLHGGVGCNAGGDCGNPDASQITTTPNLSFLGIVTTNSNGNFTGTDFMNGTCGTPWASWGILQTKVKYAEWPTWPMIAISTAWSADYRFAKFRACVNGDSAKVTYFTNQNSASGTDYSNAVSRATSSPNALVPSGQFGPTNIFPNETNEQYLAAGCIATHFSGNWYSSQAICYLNNNFGTGTGCSGFSTDNFINILNTKGWPGGLP